MVYDRTIRQRVINLACRQAADGAHYLWGADGSRPNDNGVVKFVTPSWGPGPVVFCTAKCEVDGTCLCSGRYSRITPPKGSDSTIKAGDANLAAFVAKYKGRSQINWSSEPTPHQMSGTDIKGGPYYVWGEGCDDTRHFDCIHFINWCFNGGKTKPRSYDMLHYFYSVEPANRVLNAVEITDVNDVMPADVLLYGSKLTPARDFFADAAATERAGGFDTEAEIDEADLAVIEGRSGGPFVASHHVSFVPQKGMAVGLHHIAFATGKGKGRVHAAENQAGVIQDDDWGTVLRRIRFPDSFFK